MPIELKMPALSPTMTEGTIAKWLVKVGDQVQPGDLIAEIETDKAAMEFEAVDEGTVSEILVPAGTDGVKVGTVIARLSADGEAASAPAPKAAPATAAAAATPVVAPAPQALQAVVATAIPAANRAGTVHAARVKASPLARRLAEAKGIDLASVHGSGPGGRVIRADVENVPQTAAVAAPQAAQPAAAPQQGGAPFETIKLSNMRKTIARRLTEAKQTIPHIYLTVDIRLDRLLALRAELNAALEARGIKLSVNDLLIKALAQALIDVPACNVSFAGDVLHQYGRADISVAVSIPGGLITPIITSANEKPMSVIAQEMAALAVRAREGKLLPHEYQGGTASLSNMGMFGIKQFDAVINPPQAMIMAIGAGEQRPYVIDGKLDVATVMSVTGSFDHRAIDGADGAQLMKRFKELLEQPIALLA